MKYIPLLYQTPMVQAVLEDRKIMTRRLKGLQAVNEQPDKVEFIRFETYPDGSLHAIFQHEDADNPGSVKCPYGKPGDVLWVRETFLSGYEMDDGAFKLDEEGEYIPKVWYKASDASQWYDGTSDFPRDTPPWKPSIHMPKDACRIFLEVTDIRVERLHDINSEDAVREGIACVTKDAGRTYKFGIPDADGFPGSGEVGWKWQDWQATPTQAFEHLWQKINGTESWNANPWVWVISFKRIDKPSGFSNDCPATAVQSIRNIQPAQKAPEMKGFQNAIQQE